ncbi:hydroxymethylglutaryl-CoA synthase [Paucilactobacillus hokkaidonensis JCM 18461]|uniref:Hydroxymethylglutaryl-CoA synthase n=2 Tax=Paucilactobacillus hokkaidonensis TaxID=1193095 RepID=A0A0A1GU22_9LACO|nr:hydroxymethylglutaryl-CoA synthase [Paucilactobacillus hokkaidonensis]KRO10302.1 hydroxymethylglutaryl-CoA synthase [Paucilactobacillus hokkaidonensis]BAP85757.1 hydroxymethylglutaryl-CoA synthase [Paucilactobacillus hokkaidonensis JCM 18461]
MKIGIDKLGFYTTPYYLDLTDLAQARNVDPNKYLIGIGQSKQAVIPPTQDIVTMGASAAEQILSAEDRNQLSTVIVATESGIDNSKAAAIYVKHLLQLNDFVRTVEMKEACYAGTAAVQAARGLVSLHPDEKVLVIAADVARYGLNTSGEVTQGGGAVAILISAEPHLLAIEDPSISYSQDIMDFWRPLYASEALVDGKYSTNVYIDFFKATWQRYQEKTGRTLDDFAAIAFHLPFTKMGTKALAAVLQDRDDETATRLRSNLTQSQKLNREVGNLYTGSLYLSLISLLTHADFEAEQRIGLFSYGSGAEGEFYAGILQPNYRQYVYGDAIETILADRTKLTVTAYEKMFNEQLGFTKKDTQLDVASDPSKYALAGIKDQQRIYQLKNN